MAHLPAYPTTMTELHALRDAYRRDKAALLAAMQSTGASARGIRALLRKLSTLAGDLLQTLWQRARLPDEMALVAVGGFGRGQLFPCSDVDVLLLLPDAVVPELRSRLEGFIGSCWDAGLEIGSSVRTVAECLAESAGDVTVQTSLLESRLLCGSAALFGQFQHQYRAQMNPAAFVLAKTLEMRQRHTKYENTPYALEPNCKESPGGLRDLQMILWVAQAAGLGSHWKALAANGIATAFELRQIEHNEALLCLIRARLHAAAGRREDRLVFDLQTAVAESFGYRSQAPDGTRLPMRASETLMRRYYWAAKAVSQLNQILLLNIEERLSPSTHAPRPLNARFFEKAGRIEVAGDDLYTRDPHAILETFLLYQTTPGLGDLSARTLRALYNARSVMDSAFRRDPVNRSAFMRILQQPSGITHAMRLMNQTSVLGRYLWPFRRIVGQMQHDLFHVYTVDQHILMVLRNVRRFFIAEHAHEYPFCSQLAGDWDKPWVLYVAALFHDIGKGRGGDHSQIGAAEVRRFCHQHGVHRDDARRIEFLVREHLTMSTVAQKQDLSDPDVIAAFAHRMGDERNLTALYLLTVADIRGTSPKVWNAWKGKLLEDLYRATLRALGGRVPDAATEIEARKREALVLLALDAQPFDAHKALWATLGVSYFMRHDAADIAWHARHLSRHVGAAKPVVRARPSLAGDGLQAMVYTADQADLFARICSYFDRAGFSILDARVHTASNGYALDTFQVVASSQPGHYRELTQMVESDLTRLIEAGGPLSEPARKRVSRRVKSFPVAPRVGLQPDEKAQRWLLTISASDRAGLLYLVARVLAQHRLSVQLAKVSTLGERVEDSFLIQGPELQNNARRIQIETELLRALSDEESMHEPAAAGGA
ncbi:[protein-PII] uridylyltransferase [Verminephrobacter aporrectodeae subsp. tuberculatae]|uniref:[protein-PII] uridylyltransferase n=1 Tax=Verminephrobacter aporrectodeae TaxID=1110389 RepID=UPI0022433397|nr:[protein-PII] uridylyltransferase [Verminephrobacter aporrectodeae]MCW8165790.1 [protein-PII] uridylyltransferase [Verminephrobacter aporrectodeae subsp. tuberculatae]MCW8169918.1 [protein-PII] uridylyltransferase [Verminephrobacter aporrectodeae subsp. tuberculatae]